MERQQHCWSGRIMQPLRHGCSITNVHARLVRYGYIARFWHPIIYELHSWSYISPFCPMRNRTRRRSVTTSVFTRHIWLMANIPSRKIIAWNLHTIKIVMIQFRQIYKSHQNDIFNRLEKSAKDLCWYINCQSKHRKKQFQIDIHVSKSIFVVDKPWPFLNFCFVRDTEKKWMKPSDCVNAKMFRAVTALLHGQYYAYIYSL